MASGEYEELLPKLSRCLEFIRAGLAAGRGVLVHCHAGKSRAAAVVLAWIMAAAQLPYHEAFSLLRNQHSVACPNRTFEQDLSSNLLSIDNPDLDAELIEQLRLIEQTIAEPAATSSPREPDQEEKAFFEPTTIN